MLLNLFTYLIIPVFTLDFVKGYNWFTTNFSVIGSQWNRQSEFVLWGIFVGGYYFLCLRAIIGKMPSLQQKRLLWLPTFALMFLVCAITTPYLPEITPFKAVLHVAFALIASAFLLLSLFLVILHLYHIEPETYTGFLFALTLLTIFCAILFLSAGIISSALEIFFTLSSAILVNHLYRAVSSASSSEVL